MGGRNSRPHRVLRIRYRSSDKGERKIRSCMVFGEAGRVRKRRRGSKVLRICKVTDEELLHVGEHSPLNASGREVDRLLGRDMLEVGHIGRRGREDKPFGSRYDRTEALSGYSGARGGMGGPVGRFRGAGQET